MNERTTLIQAGHLRSTSKEADRLARRNEMLRKLLEALQEEPNAKPTRSQDKKPA